MSNPFVLFGRDHLIVLALTVVLPLALASVTRRSETERRVVDYGFAAFLIATWVLWFYVIFDKGWQSVQTLLPMNLCDWATIAAIVTLIRPNQKSYELAYFWAFAGTLQAMLTPDLQYGFPDLRFVVFFAFHGGVIAAALYLTFAVKLRPYPRSLPRVAAWSLFYAASAGFIDWLFKVNFGYLRAKPAEASLFDLLAPWPWYIAELILLGVLSIFIYYAPFWIWDQRKRS